MPARSWAAGEGGTSRPAHFVERYGLIIIIALGESIVSIGVGAAGLPLDAPRITAALLGMVVAACPVVGLLRLGHLHVAGQDHRGDRGRASGPGTRPVLVPPHADGVRHRAVRPRPEGDAGPRRGTTGGRPRHRLVRRACAVHGFPRRVAAPNEWVLGPRPASGHGRAARADPGRQDRSGARVAGPGGCRLRGADRLRGASLSVSRAPGSAATVASSRWRRSRASRRVPVEHRSIGTPRPARRGRAVGRSDGSCRTAPSNGARHSARAVSSCRAAA